MDSVDSYLIGYLVAAIVALVASVLIIFRVYRWITGRIIGRKNTSDCSSCSCCPPVIKLSVSIEEHENVFESNQKDCHGCGSD